MIDNIFECLTFSPDKEIEEIIFEDKKIRIARIMSLDQETPEMDQDELEIVILLEGKAKILLDEKIINLKKGDVLKIPPHKIHRLTWQDHALWLCIFTKWGQRAFFIYIF